MGRGRIIGDILRVGGSQSIRSEVSSPLCPSLLNYVLPASKFGPRFQPTLRGSGTTLAHHKIKMCQKSFTSMHTSLGR